MQNNDLLLSARVSELEKEVASLKGQVAQSNRLTIWQFISFTLVMAGTLFGTLAWVSGSLREENRQTREALQKQIEQTEKNLNGQFTQMEKRFEDLRQVVLSQQKQTSPQR
jgi:hypothetical protein